MNWAVHAARAGLAEDATSKYHRGEASTSSRQAWGRGGPGRPNELTVPQLTVPQKRLICHICLILSGAGALLDRAIARHA